MYTQGDCTKNFLTCLVHREGQDEHDRKRHDKQDYFWVAGLPCIMHIMRDPPAERILFFFSSKLSCNRPAGCSYYLALKEHPEVMGLIERSNRAIDPKERREMMARIEQKIFDEMPAIGLFTQNLQYLVQEGVNLVISDLGIYDLKKTGYR